MCFILSNARQCMERNRIPHHSNLLCRIGVPLQEFTGGPRPLNLESSSLIVGFEKAKIMQHGGDVDNFPIESQSARCQSVSKPEGPHTVVKEPGRVRLSSEIGGLTRDRRVRRTRGKGVEH